MKIAESTHVSEVEIQDHMNRFNDRADDYARYRPPYPEALLSFLQTRCALTSSSIVADIGSGTGSLSALFLSNGNFVYGVEPNSDMRLLAERLLAEQRTFASINATAEATGLEDASVDFVVVGRAFHWFEAQRAMAEMSRILRPNGWAIIVSTNTDIASNPFMKAYNAFRISYFSDYKQLKERRDSDHKLLRSANFKCHKFFGYKLLDFESLKGLVFSLSVSPRRTDAKHVSMLEALRAVFRKYERDGVVPYEYEIIAHYGSPHGAKY